MNKSSVKPSGIKGSDRPTQREINDYGIRNGVATDWYSLGIQLIPNDLQGQLNIIKINNFGDAITCTTQMFDYWLQVDTTASWSKLIEALRKTDKYQLAKTVCEKCLQEEPSSENNERREETEVYYQTRSVARKVDTCDPLGLLVGKQRFQYPPPPPLPSTYVPRKILLDDIVTKLLQATNDPNKYETTLTITGAGGFGKTTTVISLCHHPDVKKHFSNGFIFVKLGPQTNDPSDILSGIYNKITGEQCNNTVVEEKLNQLINICEYKFLVIIDDVWHVKDAEVLVKAFSNSKTILTTRMNNIKEYIPSKQLVFIGPMTQDEAFNLLTKGVIDSQLSQEDVNLLNELAQDAHLWPLLLYLIREQLSHNLKEYNWSYLKAIQNVQAKLHHKGLTAFDKNNVKETSESCAITVETCIERTLRLGPLTKLSDKIKTLVLFTGIGTSLQTAVLNILWNTSKEEAEETVNLLWAYGLAQFTDITVSSNSKSQLHCLKVNPVISHYIIDCMDSEKVIILSPSGRLNILHSVSDGLTISFRHSYGVHGPLESLSVMDYLKYKLSEFEHLNLPFYLQAINSNAVTDPHIIILMLQLVKDALITSPYTISVLSLIDEGIISLTNDCKQMIRTFRFCRKFNQNAESNLLRGNCDKLLETVETFVKCYPLYQIAQKAVTLIKRIMPHCDGELLHYLTKKHLYLIMLTYEYHDMTLSLLPHIKLYTKLHKEITKSLMNGYPESIMTHHYFMSGKFIEEIDLISTEKDCKLKEVLTSLDVPVQVYTSVEQYIERFEQDNDGSLESEYHMHKLIQLVKERNLTIELCHAKIMFCGPSKAGKTSFIKLLQNIEFDDKNYTSTDVGETAHVLVSDMVKVRGTEWFHLSKELQIIHLTQLLSKTNDERFEVDLELTASPTEVWNILTLFDTGGQPEYINLLPAINAIAAVNFLVLDVSNGEECLDQPVLAQHSSKTYNKRELGYTNLNLLECLLSLITESTLKHTSVHEIIQIKGDEHPNPVVGFIGTFFDQLSLKLSPEESMENVLKIGEKLNRLVQSVNADEKLNVWTYSKNTLITVDNTIAGKPQNQKSVAEYIRSEITKLLKLKGHYEIPITWFILQLQVSLEQKVFLDLDHVKALSDKIMPSDQKLSKSEIKVILKFHHLLGVLLYFDEVDGMKDFVITDPQWLFNNLAKLMTCTFKKEENCDAIILQKFNQGGIFNKNLLHSIDLDICINSESFLSLLEYLKIIAPMDDRSMNYFMPSILPTYKWNTDDKDIPNGNLFGSQIFYKSNGESCSVQPLLVTFNFGTVPRGLFCFLVVQLLKNNSRWELYDINEDTIINRYDNLITLRIDKKSYLSIIDRVKYLELQVRNKGKSLSSMHYKAQRAVTVALISLCEKFGWHFSDVRYGYLCSECLSSSDHLTLLSTDEPVPQVFPQDAECRSQSMPLTEQHKVWFDPTQVHVSSDQARLSSSMEMELTEQGMLLSTGPTDRSTIGSLSIYNKRPKMRDLYKIVVPKIAADWRYLAVSMDYPVHTTDSIKGDYFDSQIRCLRLLEDWLSTSRSNEPKTWGVLLEHIKNFDHLQEVAEGITRQLEAMDDSYYH